MGSRAAADEGGKTGGSGMSSSSLSPYASGDLQNNQKHHRQLILIFFLCFQSFFLSLLLRFGSASLSVDLFFSFSFPIFFVSGDGKTKGSSTTRLLSGLAGAG
jgi:hypothetical protein